MPDSDEASSFQELALQRTRWPGHAGRAGRACMGPNAWFRIEKEDIVCRKDRVEQEDGFGPVEELVLNRRDRAELRL